MLDRQGWEAILNKPIYKTRVYNAIYKKGSTKTKLKNQTCRLTGRRICET